MKKQLLCGMIVVCLCFSAPLFSQSVIGSKHDLTSLGGTSTILGILATNTDRVCAFCHTPHQPDPGGGNEEQDPLWNHQLSAAGPYGVYDSTTLDADDVGNLEELVVAPADGTATVSHLCLSCHDGTIGVGSLANDPYTTDSNPPSNAATPITGSANMGTDLSNDHPINFDYAPVVVQDGGLVAAPTAPLFAGKVQCATCHDPHNSLDTPFLVMSNTASALCVDCHIK